MLAVVIGILVAISVFLLLEKTLYRKVIGLALISSTINLIILNAGKLSHNAPAFVKPIVNHNNHSDLSNPLPQALILTAIVIGFSLLAYAITILKVVLTRPEKK